MALIANTENSDLYGALIKAACKSNKAGDALAKKMGDFKISYADLHPRVSTMDRLPESPENVTQGRLYLEGMYEVTENQNMSRAKSLFERAVAIAEKSYMRYRAIYNLVLMTRSIEQADQFLYETSFEMGFNSGAQTLMMKLYLIQKNFSEANNFARNFIERSLDPEFLELAGMFFHKTPGEYGETLRWKNPVMARLALQRICSVEAQKIYMHLVQQDWYLQAMFAYGQLCFVNEGHEKIVTIHMRLEDRREAEAAFRLCFLYGNAEMKMHYINLQLTNGFGPGTQDIGIKNLKSFVESNKEAPPLAHLMYGKHLIKEIQAAERNGAFDLQKTKMTMQKAMYHYRKSLQENNKLAPQLQAQAKDELIEILHTQNVEHIIVGMPKHHAQLALNDKFYHEMIDNLEKNKEASKIRQVCSWLCEDDLMSSDQKNILIGKIAAKYDALMLNLYKDQHEKLFEMFTEAADFYKVQGNIELQAKILKLIAKTAKTLGKQIQIPNIATIANQKQAANKATEDKSTSSH